MFTDCNIFFVMIFVIYFFSFYKNSLSSPRSNDYLIWNWTSLTEEKKSFSPTYRPSVDSRILAPASFGKQQARWNYWRIARDLATDCRGKCCSVNCSQNTRCNGFFVNGFLARFPNWGTNILGNYFIKYICRHDFMVPILP